MGKMYQFNTKKKGKEKKIGDVNCEHCLKAEATPPQQAEMLLKALSALGTSDCQGGQQVIFTPVSTRQSQNL